MRQEVPIWLAVVVVIIVVVVVGVGYWIASNRQKFVSPPEHFQPGRTGIPQQAMPQAPAPQGQ
ncbi:MAG: hypothetical protein RMK89_08390 [Armatimonadota bacterium]|nr:hypothetical protein [Armatimonadota bacterium]MDW8143464.1 hypothetical protein [Armatimonadota bacterium]